MRFHQTGSLYPCVGWLVVLKAFHALLEGGRPGLVRVFLHDTGDFNHLPHGPTLGDNPRGRLAGGTNRPDPNRNPGRASQLRPNLGPDPSTLAERPLLTKEGIQGSSSPFRKN